MVKHSGQSPTSGSGERRGTRIEFTNVEKVFASKKKGSAKVTAVDDVTLTVESGEVIGIIGYSGAGKSTLVRLINGLDSPTSGSLKLDGTEIVGMSEAKMRGLRRNIEFPLKLAGIAKAERKKRVQELLEFVGLGERGNSYPEQLSGGQKQRVGIARALATNPSLLLADEATSALDPETTQEILEVLRKVNQEFGITIVVITHEMEVVRSIADKVAVMENGSVVEYGEIYEIFSAPKTDVAKRFVATALRNEPDSIEADDLLAHDGRLFTIELTENSGFFEAAATLRSGGGSINIVHGGVTTLQQQSFGKMTVRLNGSDDTIDEFYRTLSQRTHIEEIKR